MEIGHDVAVVGQSVEVGQSETVAFFLIINGQEGRKHIHLFERILGLVAVGVFEVEIGIEGHKGFLHLQLHAHVVLSVVVAPEDALVVGMVVGHGVECLVRPSPQAHHIALRESVALHSILPVGVHTRVLAQIEGQCHGVGRILGIVVVIHGFVHLLVFGSIEHLQFFGDGGEAHVGVEIHLEVATLAVLGGDEHHAISGHRTVDGSRSTVFQHLHRLDVLRVHVLDVARKTVYDVERCIVSEGLHTTYFHPHAGSGIAAALHDAHACNLSLQGLGGIGGGALGQFAGVDRGDGSRHVGPTHGAVAHNHHFVERLGIFRDRDVHVAGGAQFAVGEAHV